MRNTSQRSSRRLQSRRRTLALVAAVVLIMAMLLPAFLRFGGL